MSCSNTREALTADPTTRDPEVLAHLEGCEACARFGAESLGLKPPVDAISVEGLWEQVEADVQAETGPVAWLRSRPTPWRVGAALGGSALIVGLVAVFLVRVDLAVYPVARFGALGLLLAGLVVGAVRSGLRSVARPGGLDARWWIAGSLVAVAAVGFLPPAHQAHPASLLGVGDDFAFRAVQCLAFGALVGLPFLGGMWVLDRAGRPWLGTGAWMAAVAGGVLGTLALHLHCPLVSPTHLLAGHSTVLPLLLVVPLLRRRL